MSARVAFRSVAAHTTLHRPPPVRRLLVADDALDDDVGHQTIGLTVCPRARAVMTLMETPGSMAFRRTLTAGLVTS